MAAARAAGAVTLRGGTGSAGPGASPPGPPLAPQPAPERALHPGEQSERTRGANFVRAPPRLARAFGAGTT